MRRTGVLSVAVLLVLAGCGEEERAGSNQDAAGFTVLRAAVEFPSVSDWVPPGEGLRLLVPLGDCVLGVGSYANGHRTVAANWAGDATCSRLSLDPPARDDEVAPDSTPDHDGWRGGGLAGVVLPWHGGVLIGASNGLTRRLPDGTAEPLAVLPFDRGDSSPDAPDRSPRATSAVRVGDRLLVVGNGSEPATVYVSDDGGATVRGVALPQAPGAEQPDQPRLLATDSGETGKTVVATGYGGTWLTTWRSTDGGGTWTAARQPLPRTAPDEPGEWEIHLLLRAGTAWHVLGAVRDPRAPDRPLWLTSDDGVAWTPRDTTAMGEGGIVAATVDKAGDLVLVGVRDQATGYSPDSRATYCGVVWTGPVGGPFERGELDCTEHPPTATATLADGRVLIAGNRDLWVRP
jgi:hypothetical protein